LPVLLAALPLVCVLIGMAVLHTSAVVAGLAGFAIAAGLALFGPFNLAEAVNLPLGSAAAGTLAEAAHSTITILWIVFPALALYAYQSHVGAIDRIRDALAGLTDNRRIQALLIAWFFGLFIEGAAGFGTPVALAAPLLLGIGYSPIRAVTLALLGHAAGVSFGAVGTPTLAQLELTGLGAQALAGHVALLHACLGWILLFAMVRLADDGPVTRTEIGWTLLAGVCFFVPFLALAFLAGPELPSLAGALIGTAVFVTLLRRRGAKASIDLRSLAADLTPYLIIVGLVLATRLIEPLRAATSELTLNWNFLEQFSGSFAPLYHPGTLLWGGLIIGALITSRTSAIWSATREALKRLVAVAMALFVMLALSRLMVQSGMITTLADTAATTGTFWPLFAPAVGVLGTFITGSATTSNILFTELQVSAAEALSLPTTTMVAAQGFGSAIGNIIAPHNIIAGAATVGLVGKEGSVLARTVLWCALYTGLGGAAILVATQLF
jgi:lactate permease